MSDRKIESSTPYVDRLTKLIPAEFVAAYLAIYNLILTQSEMSDGTKADVLAIVATILFCSLPFYLWLVLRVNSFPQIVASMISLIVWVLSLGVILSGSSWYLPIYSTIAIILWTTLSPLLVRS